MMENGTYDVIVVGAGLAGVCAAHALTQDRSILLIEGKQPAAGASGAAAGLVNPLMARKANPTWRFEAALDALNALCAETGADALRASEGVLRPALDEKQAHFFQQTAQRHPAHGAWLPPATVARRFPALAPAYGALLVRTGTALNVPAFIEAVLAHAVQRGLATCYGTPMQAWEETPTGTRVHLADGRCFTGRHVLLALGYGYTADPVLAGLNLHPIKGQTLRVRRPPGLGVWPALSAGAYVVPDGPALLLGSTYEHTFAHLRPTPEGTARILAQAAAVVPALAQAEVLAARAGVRVTVPGTRLPMLGPLPGHQRTWVFTGLGAKGLLMAPLLARGLPRFLHDSSMLPDEVFPHHPG